jgi:hypothetical protein
MSSRSGGATRSVRFADDAQLISCPPPPFMTRVIDPCFFSGAPPRGAAFGAIPAAGASADASGGRSGRLSDSVPEITCTVLSGYRAACA